MSSNSLGAAAGDVAAALAAIVGRDHVSTDATARRHYSTDLSYLPGAIALELRDGPRDLYDAHGCRHRQRGRYYPHQEMMGNPALRHLLHGVKNVLDRARRMNPGALGLR